MSFSLVTWPQLFVACSTEKVFFFVLMQGEPGNEARYKSQSRLIVSRVA